MYTNTVHMYLYIIRHELTDSDALEQHDYPAELRQRQQQQCQRLDQFIGYSIRQKTRHADCFAAFRVSCWISAG